MYKVKVVYSNGNENIKTTNDFQEAREIYNETKERHQSTGCKISFIEVVDGEDKQRWSKQCNMYDNPINEILQDQIDDIGKIIDMKSYYFDMVGFTDKKQDNILHMDVENARSNNYTEEERLDTYEELKEITLLRREYKQKRDEIKAIEKELQDAQRILRTALNKYNQVGNNYEKTRKYVDNTGGDLKHKIHKYEYKDNKEKHELINQLKQQYSRIMIDEPNSQIMCFNNCSTNRRAVKKAQ